MKGIVAQTSKFGLDTMLLPLLGNCLVQMCFFGINITHREGHVLNHEPHHAGAVKTLGCKTCASKVFFTIFNATVYRYSITYVTRERKS